MSANLSSLYCGDHQLKTLDNYKVTTNLAPFDFVPALDEVLDYIKYRVSSNRHVNLRKNANLRGCKLSENMGNIHRAKAFCRSP